MAFASGAYHGLYTIPEVSYGVTPANPDWDVFRHTDCSLQLTRDTYECKELRSDRAVADVRLGTYKVEGDIGFCLSYEAFDQYLEAFMGGTWAPAYNLRGETLDINATNRTIARTVAGNFITDGIEAGDILTLAGTNAANRGSFLVATVAANLITVTLLAGSPAMFTVAGDTDCTITTNKYKLNQGTTQRSFSILRRFADITQFEVFSGCSPSKLTLDIKPDGIVTGKMTFIGANLATALPAGSTYNAASTNSPMDCFTATILEGGTAFALASALTLELDNGLEANFVLGSKYAAQISWGRSTLTGKLTAFFENLTLFNKFLNETRSSLKFTTSDGTRTITWLINNLQYTSANNPVTDEKPIMLEMSFNGLHDTTYTNMEIRRNPGVITLAEPYPSYSPSASPSKSPSASPSGSPSASPSASASGSPSASPSASPST